MTTYITDDDREDNLNAHRGAYDPAKRSGAIGKKIGGYGKGVDTSRVTAEMKHNFASDDDEALVARLIDGGGAVVPILKL
jgi:hypothetical protein